jgi:hypothetical protein
MANHVVYIDESVNLDGKGRYFYKGISALYFYSENTLEII